MWLGFRPTYSSGSIALTLGCGSIALTLGCPLFTLTIANCKFGQTTIKVSTESEQPCIADELSDHGRHD
jgi:hypothetical protein